MPVQSTRNHMDNHQDPFASIKKLRRFELTLQSQCCVTWTPQPRLRVQTGGPTAAVRLSCAQNGRDNLFQAVRTFFKTGCTLKMALCQ